MRKWFGIEVGLKKGRVMYLDIKIRAYLKIPLIYLEKQKILLPVLQNSNIISSIPQILNKTIALHLFTFFAIKRDFSFQY